MKNLPEVGKLYHSAAVSDLTLNVESVTIIPATDDDPEHSSPKDAPRMMQAT